MVFWGMRNGGSGQRNKGAEVEFWGVEGREMGFIGLVTRAQKCEKEKKKKPFCKFQGLQNGIIFEKIAQKSQVGESSPNFILLSINALQNSHICFISSRLTKL